MIVRLFRWKDNDQYGHVNNVVYYEWIDSIVNEYLIDRCGMNPQKDPVVGFVVSSSCSFYSPLRYPQRVHLGLNVQRMGTSSVDYRVAIFPSESSDVEASAVGGFTHVFVDRQANKSRAIPPSIRTHLEKLLCPNPPGDD